MSNPPYLGMPDYTPETLPGPWDRDAPPREREGAGAIGPVLDVPALRGSASVEVEGVSGSRSAPPAIVMTDAAQRVLDYATRFRDLTNTLIGYLGHRATYERELYGYLSAATQLRTMAHWMYEARRTRRTDTGSPAFRDAAQALERAALGAVDAAYPWDVSHPLHHRPVQRKSGDIVDLLHDEELIEAIERLSSDVGTHPLLRSSVLGVLLHNMVRACEQVARTQRAPRLMDVVDAALEHDAENALGAARHHAEHTARHYAESTVEWLERGEFVISGTFDLLALQARLRLAHAAEQGASQVDEVLDQLQTMFHLEAEVAEEIRHGALAGTEEGMHEAQEALEEHLDLTHVRGRELLGTVVQSAFVALSWAAVCLLATEPADERHTAGETLHWALEVGHGVAEAAVETICVMERGGELLLRNRNSVRRLLHRLAHFAESVEKVLPLVDAVVNVVEGANEIRLGFEEHDALAVDLGALHVAGGLVGGSALAWGLICTSAAATGIGGVVLAATGAVTMGVEGLTMIDEALQPPAAARTLDLLRTLRRLQATDGGTRHRLAARLGLDAAIRTCFDAARAWDWWALLPDFGLDAEHHDQTHLAREAVRITLRNAGAADEEAEALVRDTLSRGAMAGGMEAAADAFMPSWVWSDDD